MAKLKTSKTGTIVAVIAVAGLTAFLFLYSQGMTGGGYANFKRSLFSKHGLKATALVCTKTGTKCVCWSGNSPTSGCSAIEGSAVGLYCAHTTSHPPM